MTFHPFWILNPAGDPVPAAGAVEWAIWFDRATRDRSRILAQSRDERVGVADVLVSTVFMGLDHNFSDAGPPLLWETMILGGPLDGYQVRYPSAGDAMIGHAVACSLANEASPTLDPLRSSPKDRTNAH